MFVLVIFGTAPSSSGLGLWLLKSATRVGIPSGLQFVTYFDKNRDGDGYYAAR